MHHWEASSFRWVRWILGNQGRGMGMIRARRWSFPRKCLASFSVPLLMGHRLVRGARAARRCGEKSPVVLLSLFPLSILWTFGELRGYWCRDPHEAMAGVSDVEKNRHPFVDAIREPIRKPF